MWIVIVKQNEDMVRFGFNRLNDALEFLETCLECGDEGTETMIKAEKEED